MMTFIADSALAATHMAHHQQASETRRLAVFSMTTEDRDTQITSYLEKCLEDAWKNTIEISATMFSAPGLQSVGEEIERSIWFGLNCSIRRDLFLKHGGFNEYFRASDEEGELGSRLYLSGVEFVFEPLRLLTHKNSKNLEIYFSRCWGATGSLDPYRVFQLGQKNAQTQHLVSMYHGYLLDRLTARFAWTFSAQLRTLADWLKPAAERTRQLILFGAWARTRRTAEYWNHVRATGCTAKQLQDAAGRSKKALMLHSICDPQAPEESSYYVSPRKFHRLMRWMRFEGYKTASTTQWHNDSVPAKHVLLTFDDGYDDLYTELFPFLVENRFTAVIFLVAGQIGASNVWDQKTGLRARNLLTLDHIREMQRYGVEFGSHTLTHPYLPEVSDEELHREVAESKQRLEDLLGIDVASFAYPFGGVDRRVRSAVINAGYKSAFTVFSGSNGWNDPYCQRRAEVNEYTSLVDFAWKIRTGFAWSESIGARLRSLENSLPTSFLRNTTGRLARMGHETARYLAREARRRKQAQSKSN
jgi:peptidoglycan/xylan/chitin deacetylase (PgdA/CDA1 family)